MSEIDEMIPIGGISETYLFNSILNMKKNCTVKGKFPKYTKKMYERLEHNTFDFTKSFLFYALHNRHLLNFYFDVVTTPSYVVYSIEEKMNALSPISIYLTSHPGMTSTRKMSFKITIDFLNNMEYVNDVYIKIYDYILSDMNNLMANSLDKAIYLYKIIAGKNLSNDTCNFMARFGISQKGINVVDPNGPLPNIDTTANGPFTKLGIKVEENPWIEILKN